MFSATTLLCLSLIPTATSAQQCTEKLQLEDFEIQTKEVSYIEYENTSDQPMSLYGQTLEAPSGEELELSGFLLPGESTVILLSEEFLAEETTPPEPEYQTAVLLLNELLANPEEDEAINEFIELYNPNDFEVNLAGWKLSDKSKSFLLDDFRISPKSFFVLYRPTTGLALNNSNESVYLHDPFEALIDSVSYEATTEGASLNREAPWYEAEPSPGQENNEGPLEDTEPQEELEEEEEEEVEADEQETEHTPDKNLSLLQLSELLPNPEGSDELEWIELFNPSDETISLTGLEVTDTSTSYFFPEEIIQPESYYLLERTVSGIALNNTDDTITLKVSDKEVDTFTYEESTEGLSWNMGDPWHEAAPTPNQQNTPPQEEEIVQTRHGASQQAETSSKKKPSWEEATHNETLTLQGIITTPANILKAKTLFLTVGDEMIEVYGSKASFPEHQIGDIIQIQGKKSITTTGERLLFQDEEHFTLLAHTNLEPTKLKQKQEALLLSSGAYVQIEGRLVEQNRKDLLVVAGEDEWIISLEHLPNLPLLPLHQKLILRGSLELKEQEPIIIPYLVEHIVENEEEGLTQEPDEPIELDRQKEDEHTYTEPLLAGGTIAGIGSYLFREKLLSWLKALKS